MDIQATVSTTSDVTVPASRRLLLSIPTRKLQGSDLLSEGAGDAILATFQQIIELDNPIGIRVVGGAITSLTQVDGDLQFDVETILEVACAPDPCTEAEAEARGLNQVSNSIDMATNFASVLAENIMEVDDCGTAFSCAELLTSAENTIVTSEITQRE